MSKTRTNDSSSGTSGSAGSPPEKPDRDAMRKALSESSLSLDNYNKYAQSQYVKETYYTESSSVNGSDNFEPVSTSSSSGSGSSSDSGSSSEGNSQNSESGSGGMSGGMPGGMADRDDSGGSAMSSSDFTITAFSNDTALDSETFSIKSGSAITADSKMQVMISESLATLNGLSTGDTITVTDTSDSSKTWEMKIAGIYEKSSSSQGFDRPGNNPMNDSNNALRVSTTTLKEMGLDAASTSGSDNAAQISYTYVLNNVEDYNAFSQECKDKGLSDTYKVESPDADAWENSITPLKSMKSIAVTAVIVILTIGALILAAVSIAAARNRDYEYCVLTAIGVKKSKVCAQHLLSTIIITALGMVLGIGAGFVAAQQVTTSMLKSQVSTASAQSQKTEEKFGRAAGSGAPGSQSGQSAPDSSDNSGNFAPQTPGSNGSSDLNLSFANSDVKVSINAMQILYVVLIALGLAILASLAGLITVIRYEPLQILAGRS